MQQDPEIRNFYEFNDNDLAVNRSGRLTDSQLQAVKSRNNLFRMVGLAGGGFLILIALLLILILLIVLAVSFFARDWSHSIIGMIALLAGIVILGGGGAFLVYFGLSKSKSNYVLRSTQGKVTLRTVNLTTSKGHSYKQYQMQIGGVEFVLDDDLVGHIKEGETYVMYYVDYQDGSEGIIQSVERLA